jgi:DNA-binding CsgD family transcriptional regulator
VPEAGDDVDEVRVAVLLDVGELCTAAGRWSEVTESVRDARMLLARMPASRFSARAALDLAGLAAVAEAHTSEAVVEFDALRELIAEPRSRNLLTADHAVALICLGAVQHVHGHWGEAALDLTRGIALVPSDRTGLLVYASVELSFVRVRQSRWDDARVVAHRVTATFEASGDEGLEPLVAALQGLVFVLGGDFASGLPLLDSAAASTQGRPIHLVSVVLFHARLAVEIARNDWLRLYQRLDDGEDPGYRHPYRPGEWRALRLLAAWHLDRWVEVRRRLGEWSTVPDSEQDPYYFTFVAIEAQAEKRYSSAHAAILSALALLSLDCDPLGRTWVRIVAGTFLSHHGRDGAPDPVRGLAAYEEAQTELVALGATAYAALCEKIIRQTSAELARATQTDAAVMLTEQQLRVAELVAEGYTSVEIGQILHLSSKTINFHVQNIIRRLGLGNRREIRRLLARD